MLLSFVNMKLRDDYSNLDAMCEDLNISRDEITEKLKSIGYVYNVLQNQFK